MGFWAHLVFLTVFFISGTAAAQGDVCLSLKPSQTQINIELVTPEPTYQFAKDMKQLTDGQRSAQWLRENNLDELWSHNDLRTAGTAASGWELLPDITLISKPVDQFGAYYCTFVLHMNIAILFKTEINIAREYPQGTCQYDAIDGHEYKHYQVNRYVMEQAVEKMRRDLPAIIRDMETQGHFPRGEIEERRETMSRALEDMFRIYMKEQLAKEMRALNAKVDTPEEYDRVGKLMEICKIKEKRKMKQRVTGDGPRGFSDKGAPAQ